MRSWPRKIENDTAAFVRGIAEKRHRPLKWADQVVRKSVSLTENEAKKQGIIDIIANDPADLMSKLNGRKVELASGPSS